MLVAAHPRHPRHPRTDGVRRRTEVAKVDVNKTSRHVRNQPGTPGTTKPRGLCKPRRINLNCQRRWLFQGEKRGKGKGETRAQRSSAPALQQALLVLCHSVCAFWYVCLHVCTSVYLYVCTSVRLHVCISYIPVSVRNLRRTLYHAPFPNAAPYILPPNRIT